MPKSKKREYFTRVIPQSTFCIMIQTNCLTSKNAFSQVKCLTNSNSGSSERNITFEEKFKNKCLWLMIGDTLKLSILFCTILSFHTGLDYIGGTVKGCTLLAETTTYEWKMVEFVFLSRKRYTIREIVVEQKK